MTVQEAIEKLMCFSSTNGSGQCTDYEHNDAKRIAIKCMKEVEQYRALGTVEELKEASERRWRR